MPGLPPAGHCGLRGRARAWAGAALIPAILLLLAGCAGTGLRPLEAGAIGPAAVRLDDVPFVAGDDGHCGPAALAATLRWSGRNMSVADLAPRLLTPARGGTLEHDLAGTAREEGRLAVPIRGVEAVFEEVAAGHPVIVLQNLGLSWYPQWHYAVVTGYDLAGGTIDLHSGGEAHRRVGLSTFRQTFERGGERALVVLPAGREAASADREAALRAAAALERAGQVRAALLAYQAHLERWPDEPAARFGIGNARLALGDLEGAAGAFRVAARSDALGAAALNNLAHTLLLAGDLEAAEAAASEALRRGGPAAGAATATLEEVRFARKAT